MIRSPFAVDVYIPYKIDPDNEARVSPEFIFEKKRKKKKRQRQRETAVQVHKAGRVSLRSTETIRFLRKMAGG